jgi:hypothetical protein
MHALFLFQVGGVVINDNARLGLELVSLIGYHIK